MHISHYGFRLGMHGDNVNGRTIYDLNDDFPMEGSVFPHRDELEWTSSRLKRSLIHLHLKVKDRNDNDSIFSKTKTAACEIQDSEDDGKGTRNRDEEKSLYIVERLNSIYGREGAIFANADSS